jgi:hypothetical protein
MDLHLNHGERLPNACAKCGVAPTRETEAKLSYIPWSSFAIFAALVVAGTVLGIGLGVGPSGGGGGVVLALGVFAATRKSATLAIPLCGDCDGRWQGGETRRGLAVATFVVLFFVLPMAILPLREAYPSMSVNMVFGLAAIPFFSAPFVMILLDRKLARPRMVWARLIDERGITLVGFHSEVVRGTRGRPAHAGKRKRRRRDDEQRAERRPSARPETTADSNE